MSKNALTCNADWRAAAGSRAQNSAPRPRGQGPSARRDFPASRAAGNAARAVGAIPPVRRKNVAQTF